MGTALLSETNVKTIRGLEAEKAYCSFVSVIACVASVLFLAATIVAFFTSQSGIVLEKTNSEVAGTIVLAVATLIILIAAYLNHARASMCEIKIAILSLKE